MITYERVRVAKEYIEKKYRLKKEEEQEKKKDWEEIMSRMTQLNLAEDEAAKIKEEILHKEGDIISRSQALFLSGSRRRRLRKAARLPGRAPVPEAKRQTARMVDRLQ